MFGLKDVPLIPFAEHFQDCMMGRFVTPTRVVAGSHSEFKRWCRLNGVNDAIYLSDPEQMKGMTPGNVNVIFISGAENNPCFRLALALIEQRDMLEAQFIREMLVIGVRWELVERACPWPPRKEIA